MEQFAIRRLTEEDAEKLHALRVVVDEHSPGSMGRLWERRDALDLGSIKGNLASPGIAIFGAFCGSELVGAASVQPIRQIWPGAMEPSTYGLAAVAVAPTHRGRKISRELVRRCEECALENGAEVFLLDVFTPNPPAKGLYDSMGFEVWNTLEGAYTYDGQKYAQVGMRKFLRR